MTSLSIANEIIGIESFAETDTIGQEIIVVVQFYLLTIGYCWHLNFRKAYEIGSHVIDIPTVFVFLYLDWVERLDALVQFTHLWSGLVSRDIGNNHRSPSQLV